MPIPDLLGQMRDRLDVTFESQGIQCAAWLYLPDREDPGPVIVMAHGLGAVRTMRLDAFAERFCAAGYACLVFDYRYFGDSEGEPRQLLNIKAQQRDWQAAVAFARQRQEIDPTSVVLWGTSFGGGHVITAAAEDQTVAAVIAQCPFTDGVASSLVIDPRSSFRVTLRALRDVIGGLFGRTPIMVPTTGPPHSAALMTAPDAQPGYLRLVPDGVPFRNEVAARIALRIPTHRPGRRTPAINCPILFCVCDRDSVAPSKATLRRAARARHGVVRRYPVGHFDIYVGADFERVVRDQLAFLKHHVPTSETRK
ncbi:MAG: alpha/beta fold hydrolase [Phycisphaerales bacterium]|nr:alpha/beta fold hydrolase [Phycisphaerales bacterium]